MTLWGVARTGSCHLKCLETVLRCLVMGSGKNQFLPFQKRLETVLRREVLRSGKNWFLPFEKEERSQEGLNNHIIGTGKNQFLPLCFLL